MCKAKKDILEQIFNCNWGKKGYFRKIFKIIISKFQFSTEMTIKYRCLVSHFC